MALPRYTVSISAGSHLGSRFAVIDRFTGARVGFYSRFASAKARAKHLNQVIETNRQAQDSMRQAEALLLWMTEHYIWGVTKGV